MFGLSTCSSFLGSGSTQVFFLPKHIPWWVSVSSRTILVIRWEEWPIATLQQPALHLALSECSILQPSGLPSDIFVGSQFGSFGVPAGDSSHICAAYLKSCVNWSDRGDLLVTCQSFAFELLTGFPVSLNPNARPLSPVCCELQVFVCYPNWEYFGSFSPNMTLSFLLLAQCPCSSTWCIHWHHILSWRAFSYYCSSW